VLEELWSDLKYACRVLRRSPVNTIIAAAILALGIGANTAMFSAINQVLLRRLPFSDPDRLVRIRDRVVDSSGQVHPFNMPARHILGLRARAAIFDGVAAFSGGSMTLEGADIPERVSVVLESDSGADTLGVPVLAGRPFTEAERREGLASGVTVISHAMWTARFGGRLDAIGRTVRLDGRPFVVVGIMPPQYAFPYDAQFWMPIALDAGDQVRDFAVFARRRPGVTMAQTRDALDSIAAEVRREAGADTGPNFGFDVITIRQNLLDNEDAPLRALTDLVAVLLLVACVNVATLLLARSASRRREFAIRAALGASRGRHLRQLLAESLALAALGCGGGLLLAAWIEPLTARLFPHVLRGQLGIAAAQIDTRVLAFALAASVASAVVAGLIPGFGSWRAEPNVALSEGGRGATGGPGRRHMLGTLIVAETGLTLVLLVGAGLVIRNFVRLQQTPLGFQGRGLVATELTFPPGRYGAAAARIEAVTNIVEQVRAVPGVKGAAITTVNPLGGGTWGASAITEQAAADPAASINVNHRLITPGLLETMGIPLLRGRAFGADDRASTQPVVIVSDLLARHAWPSQDAIGKRIRIARDGAPWLTVVGVAGNVDDAHDPGVPRETWYVPYAQAAGTAAAEHVYVMTRAAGGDALALVSPVGHAIVAVDRTLAPYGAVAMDRYRDESIGRERTSATLMTGLGGFGLLLAALGVYGVMAFSVSQRTAEIGIRMALGAGTRDILPLVLGRALWLVAGGVVVGGLGALALSQVLAGLLTEVGRADLVTFAGAAALVVAAAALACLVPALVAARLDPVAALRRDG